MVPLRIGDIDSGLTLIVGSEVDEVLDLDALPTGSGVLVITDSLGVTVVVELTSVNLVPVVLVTHFPWEVLV